MKRIIILFILSVFLISCCAKSSESDEPLKEQEVMLAEKASEVKSEVKKAKEPEKVTKPKEVKKAKIEKPKTDQEKIEALKDDDPRRQQVMVITWQIQYYREQLRNIEMRKLIECYQSKEYRDTLAKIENLNKQIRNILLLGG